MQCQYAENVRVRQEMQCICGQGKYRIQIMPKTLNLSEHQLENGKHF